MVSRWPVATVLLGALLVSLPSCTSDSETDIPVPDLEGTEPQVVDLIERHVAEVRKDPSSGNAWGRLGMVYDAHSRFPQAVECYRKALELEPDMFLWNYHLAVVLETQAGDLDEITRLFEKASEDRPEYAPVFYRLGEALSRRGNYAEAKDAYEKAIALRPDFAMVYRALGQALLSLEENDAAIEKLEHSVRLDPEDGAAYAALAKAYTRAGEAERAREAATLSGEKELRLKVRDPVRSDLQRMSVSALSLMKNAVAAMKLEKYPQAIALLQMADRAKPDSPVTHFNLGVCYEATDRPDLAMTHFEKAIELGDHAKAHLSVGRILLDRGRNEEAASHLLLAVERGTGDFELNHLAAMMLVQAGRIRESLAAFERAARLEPRRANVYNNWGATLLQLSRFEDAVVQFKAALRVHPSYATAHLNAGVALEQLGRNAEAIEHYREAIAIDPDSPARDQLARLEP